MLRRSECRHPLRLWYGEHLRKTLVRRTDNTSSFEAHPVPLKGDWTDVVEARGISARMSRRGVRVRHPLIVTVWS